MPGTHDLAVLEFVNIDRLNHYLPTLRRAPEKRALLGAGDFGPNHDFVALLDYIPDFNRQVRESTPQLDEYLFGALGTRRLARRRRYVEPLLGEDSVEQRWVVLMERFVPKSDIVCHGTP